MSCETGGAKEGKRDTEASRRAGDTREEERQETRGREVVWEQEDGMARERVALGLEL